jgi:hypothetical protein
MAVLSKPVTSNISKQICFEKQIAIVHINEDQKSI